MPDTTYQPKVYRKQGGDELVAASGGAITVETGGTLTVAGVTIDASTLALNGLTASAAELNFNDDSVAGTAVASKTLVLGANKNVDTIAIADGGLKLGAAAGTAVTATAAELNLTDNMPANITFAAAAGASNISEVTITVKDAAGVAIAAPFVIDVWLSDAATGVGLTGTTASGTVTAKAASGAVFSTYTAKKDLRVQTLATGVFILEITDSAKTGYYVCAKLPSTGATKVSAQLVGGNYGA